MPETASRKSPDPSPEAAEPPPTRPRGRPKSASPKPRTPIVVTIRGTPEWEAWMDKLCAALSRQAGLPRIDRTMAIDVALGRLADHTEGMDGPPPRF